MAASKKPMHAQGTKLSYTIGETKHTIANISSIGEIAQTSEEVDVTTLDSEGGYREYIAGFKDAGQVQLGGYLTPGDESQDKLNDLYKAGTVVSWEMEFTDKSKVTFDAFVMGIAIGPVEVNGSPRFNTTLRLSGPLDIVPAE